MMAVAAVNEPFNPPDRAVGYQAGELRGAISIREPMD